MLALEPRNFDALHFLGVIAYQLGRHAQAVELISQALSLNASYAPAHSNLGNALEALGELDRALASYRQALALQPDFADALVNLGALHAARRQFEDAAACYQRGLALAPERAAVHSNLGNVFRELGRLDDAVASYRRALALEPDFAEAHGNLGNVLSDQGKPDDAIASYRRALALKPDFADAHSNLGNALVQNGQLAEAEASCRQALRLKPDSPHGKFSYALLKLLQGDYASGLPLYESRFQEKALSKLYATLHTRSCLLQDFPRWQGEDASGRRLLVWTDQGLGDSLMMLRYLPKLKQRGVGKLMVYCEPALVRVVQAIAEVDQVISSTEPMPFGKFDCHCPILSLPLAFGTRVETLPSKVPYVFVPEALRQDWARKLSGVARPRIGLLWAGGALYPKNRLRSIRLERLAPVVATPGARFVSLQKGEEACQLRETGWPVLDRMDECQDLLDTAALIEQLDLVIGVDSAVTHLVGALGKPMWMMNRFESEWRWLLERDDSPWYPTLKIFRQPRPGDWDSVIQRVASALKLYRMSTSV